MKGQYILSHRMTDLLWIYPVPLSNLKHLSMESQSSIEARNAVRPLKVCRCNCLSCCFGCACCDCCTTFEFEAAEQNRANNINTHTLMIGLLLPPWSQEHSLQVNVHPLVPQIKLHQFASHFQALILAAK